MRGPRRSRPGAAIKTRVIFPVTQAYICVREEGGGGGERTTLAFQSHKEAADIQLRGTNRSHADRDAPSTAGKQAGKRNTPIKCATSQ